MSKPVLFVSCVCLASVSAILFPRRTEVATSDGRSINQSCLALADIGSCEFYSCFERRLPCGRDGYILRTGHYYCNKIERERGNFSPEGQQFLTEVQSCLTSALKEMYQREYVNCHDLEHHAVEAITPCFMDNEFCDVFETDSEHFLDIYEVRDLFTAGAAKVWRQIAALATNCGGEALTRFSANAREAASSAINNFFSSLSDRFGK
ncbi:hypothetical protein BsWGS_11265 [Bradybaena similaris]